VFFFSSRRRHTRFSRDWSSDVCSSDLDRVRDISRADAVTVARAFEATRRIFDLEALVDRINALDNKAPAAAQIALHQRVAGALQIGRASCRGRVWIAGGAGAAERKGGG